MTMVFTILIVGLGVFETVRLWIRGKKKDMLVLVGLYLITLTFGYFYISNPYRDSLARLGLQVIDSIMSQEGR